jgi:hypothetical protein
MLRAVVGPVLEADVRVVGEVVSEMGEVVGITINAWEKKVFELNYWPGIRLCGILSHFKLYTLHSHTNTAIVVSDLLL